MLKFILNSFRKYPFHNWTIDFLNPKGYKFLLTLGYYQSYLIICVYELPFKCAEIHELIKHLEIS